MRELYEGLAHIAIQTKDIQESIAFYEMLGGKLYMTAERPCPEGKKYLALVDFAGFQLELIQSPAPVPMGEGNIPHFAVRVRNLDAAVAAIRAAGVDSFTSPEKRVIPDLFGGLQNWFLTGPSGEQIELMQSL